MNGRACAALLWLMACSSSHEGSADGGGDSAIVDAGVDVRWDASADALVDGASDGVFDAGSRLPSPYDEVARRLAEAECAVMFCDFGLRALLGGPCAEAERIALEDGDVGLWFQSVAAGRGVFDSAAFEACLVAVRDQGCDYRDFAEIPECRRAFRGLASVGESCWQPFDCAPDLVCVSHLECAGQCQIPPADGQPCADYYVCGPGLGCDDDSVCRPVAVAGESCGPAAVPCAAGLACVGLTGASRLGTCVTLDSSRSAALAEACDPWLGPHCAGDLVCAKLTWDEASETGTWRCEAPYLVGGACREAAPSGCPVESYCDTEGDPAGLMGFCRRFPRLGERCQLVDLADWFHPAECAVGLMCTADLCVPMARPGDACEGSDDCPTSDCIDGLCQLERCY